MKYFSGTASYTIPINISNRQLESGQRMVLSLGEVKDMASVTVNGIEFPIVWKTPYECDITNAVKAGENKGIYKINLL